MVMSRAEGMRASAVDEQRASQAYRVLVQPANFAKNLVYGGTAGLIGALCTFPIDLAKTRLQAQTGAQAQAQYTCVPRWQEGCVC